MKIGIDLGGSHIAVGLISEDYAILEKSEENFSAEEKQNIKEVLIPKIKNNINIVLNKRNLIYSDIENIGVACPGTVFKGEIIKAGNLGMEHYKLKEAIERELDIEVNVENDGKCAAMAEKKIGALKEYEDCIFMNLGTGIGGAVFLERQNAKN